MKGQDITSILTAGKILLAGFLLFPAGGWTAELKTAPPADFALKVNSTIISAKQFGAIIDGVKKQLTAEGVDFNTAAGRPMLVLAYESVINDLVNRVLIEQAAAKLRLEISEKEVDQWLKEMPASQDVETSTPEDILSDSLTSKDLRQSIKLQLLESKLKLKLFTEIELEENEAQEYYEANLVLFRQSPRWQVSQWKFKNEKAAKQGLAKLRQGHQPAGAKKESLGFVEEGQLAPVLEEAVRGLKPGNLSEVIARPDGYYVLKLVQAQPAQITPFDQVKDRIEELLIRQKREQLFQDWLIQKRKEAEITIRPGLIPEAAGDDL